MWFQSESPLGINPFIFLVTDLLAPLLIVIVFIIIEHQWMIDIFNGIANQPANDFFSRFEETAKIVELEAAIGRHENECLSIICRTSIINPLGQRIVSFVTVCRKIKKMQIWNSIPMFFICVKILELIIIIKESTSI